MDLDAELRFFKDHEKELLRQHEGRFALIRGDALIGTFSTFQEAWARGIHDFGNQPFLVRKVVRIGMDGWDFDDGPSRRDIFNSFSQQGRVHHKPRLV